ncbi:MAG: hypothetical protein M3Q29_12425 [Chloroflexota bacterium]|nr:hypothetical protein [Chloroflexota bacterium]
MDYGDDPRVQVPSTEMGRQMRERIAAFRSTARTEYLHSTQDGWDEANAQMLEAGHRDGGDDYHEAWERAEEGESARTILEQEEREVAERLANQYEPARAPVGDERYEQLVERLSASMHECSRLMEQAGPSAGWSERKEVFSRSGVHEALEALRHDRLSREEARGR